METNWNINRQFENAKSSKFTKLFLLFIFGTVIIILIFLAFNGQHNKTPLFENNIPKKLIDSVVSKKDTLKVINTTFNTVNIKSNNGDIILGNKKTENTK